ncbi:MAG: hypothetical protein WA667_00015 [Candidatus Nitrosopolaris sp.]
MLFKLAEHPDTAAWVNSAINHKNNVGKLPNNVRDELRDELQKTQKTLSLLSVTMLVKVNSIDTIKNKVKVTQLDIDDYGSVIPLKELELNILADDELVIQTLKNASYVAIFTKRCKENIASSHLLIKS